MGRKFWTIGLISILLVTACVIGFAQLSGNIFAKRSNGSYTSVQVSSHRVYPRRTPTPRPRPATPTPTPRPPAATPTPRPATPTPTPPVAGGGSAGSSTQMTAQENQLAQQLFTVINQDRAAANLPAYTWDANLTKSAMTHNHTMADTSCGLSHECPNEPDPGQRMKNAGASWFTYGENIGYTLPTSWDRVVAMHKSMLNEQPPNDGHRRNLLSTSFHRLGIGIYIDSSGKCWLTEDFTN